MSARKSSRSTSTPRREGGPEGTAARGWPASSSTPQRRPAEPVTRGEKLRTTAAAHGRRHGQKVPDDVRLHAFTLLASGMRPSEVAASVGVVTETLRAWRRRERSADKTPALAVPAAAAVSDDVALPAVAVTNPVHPQTAPHDPGQGLSEHEVAAILELKRRHRSMGPAQLRAQLKRFKGWRVSVRAIARVLTRAGYELVHVASRPKGEEEPRRWEAPHRNAVWQADFVELRVGPEKASLLLVQDDHSRFVVAHELMQEPTSEAVVEVLRRAIARHGKPETLYTDRGGAFLAWRDTSALASYLEAELVDHVVSRPYRPQGRGKVESLAGTVRRELWDLEHFESLDAARDALSRFLHHFNHRRAHMALDGLVPADRFFGRADEVLARMQAASRRRQGALLFEPGVDPFVSEEIGPESPCEVLRLVVARGRMELRLLGHRVDLGAVQS